MGHPVEVDSDDLRTVLTGAERMHQGGEYDATDAHNRLVAALGAPSVEVEGGGK